MQGWFNIHKLILYINSWREKDHTVIPSDGDRASDRVQHPFMIRKKLNKIGVKENFLNTMKAICEKPLAHLTISGGD